MQVTTIELPIYDLDIILVISEDWPLCNKKFDLGLEEDDYKDYALTLIYPGSLEENRKSEIYLLLKPKTLDYNTLSHELLHIVMSICDLRGIKADHSNDEPLAYLQGFIGEKIFLFRDKYLKTNLEISKK